MDANQGKSPAGTTPELEAAFDAVRTLFGQPDRRGAPVELEMIFFDIRTLFGQPNRTTESKLAGQPNRTA